MLENLYRKYCRTVFFLQKSAYILNFKVSGGVNNDNNNNNKKKGVGVFNQISPEPDAFHMVWLS